MAPERAAPLPRTSGAEVVKSSAASPPSKRMISDDSLPIGAGLPFPCPRPACRTGPNYMSDAGGCARSPVGGACAATIPVAMAAARHTDTFVLTPDLTVLAYFLIKLCQSVSARGETPPPRPADNARTLRQARRARAPV
ncbi:hypothetical protein EVAR_86508_1 [Eumeta japonica]|uniref:Uncharacterized protein n=1 Tax=Eumeta variegata TaxID=151549 RepID=A0A4C1VPN3_EUMVA|nr:hypothetical protein EVAR_86508_1 [Eumeta japonica]